MPSKKPHEGYWQERVYPTERKRKIKEGELKRATEPIAFRNSSELRDYIIKQVKEKAEELLNYISIEIQKGEIIIIGNVKTLYDKNLFLNIIKSSSPFQKVRDQVKIKPLKNLSDTKLANEVVEVIGRERIKIKELVDHSFRVKGNNLYFKAQINRDELEAKRKIYEMLSKIEGVKNITISFAVNSLNTPSEEKTEDEIKKIILNRGSLSLNKIKIFVAEGVVFLNGEVKSYNDMLYLEEKVSEIKNVKKIFNQLIIGL